MQPSDHTANRYTQPSYTFAVYWLQPENTHRRWNYYYLLFDWFGFSRFSKYKKISSCLIKSNPVHLETSCTMILSPTVSVLCSYVRLQKAFHVSPNIEPRKLDKAQQQRRRRRLASHISRSKTKTQKYFCLQQQHYCTLWHIPMISLYNVRRNERQVVKKYSFCCKNGALVQWFWVETFLLKVIGSNLSIPCHTSQLQPYLIAVPLSYSRTSQLYLLAVPHSHTSQPSLIVLEAD